MPKYMIQHRGGKEDALNSYKGLINNREIIIERSNDGYIRLKVGDGTTSYADLPYLNAPVVRCVNIDLLAANWEGSDKLYYQTVQISDITKNSKIDLRLTPEQLLWTMNAAICFTAKNSDGVVAVYAVGNKPEDDFSVGSDLGQIQVTVFETTEVGE